MSDDFKKRMEALKQQLLTMQSNFLLGLSGIVNPNAPRPPFVQKIEALLGRIDLAIQRHDSKNAPAPKPTPQNQAQSEEKKKLREDEEEKQREEERRRREEEEEEKEIEEAMAALKEQEQLEKKLDAAKEKVSGLGVKITALKAVMQEQEQKIAATIAERTTVHTQIINVQARQAALQGSSISLQNQSVMKTQELEAVNTEITKTKAMQVAAMPELTPKFQKQLEDLQEKVKALENALQENKAKIADTEAQQSNLNAELDSLQQQSASLDDTLNGQQNDLQQSKVQMSGLLDDKAGAEAAVQDLTADLSKSKAALAASPVVDKARQALRMEPKPAEKSKTEQEENRNSKSSVPKLKPPGA